MIRTSRLLAIILSVVVLSGYELSAATTLEVRGDTLFPAKHRFREVYGTFNPAFSLEATTDITNVWNLWLNYDQLNKKSHLSGCGDSRIGLSTFSTGFRGIYSFNNTIKGYLGLGLSVAAVSVKNKIYESTTHSHKTSVGGVLKSGVYMFATERVFFDIFGDYYYQPVQYHHRTNCGGVRVGIGIGVSFP